MHGHDGTQFMPPHFQRDGVELKHGAAIFPSLLSTTASPSLPPRRCRLVTRGAIFSARQQRKAASTDAYQTPHAEVMPGAEGRQKWPHAITTFIYATRRERLQIFVIYFRWLVARRPGIYAPHIMPPLMASKIAALHRRRSALRMECQHDDESYFIFSFTHSTAG